MVELEPKHLFMHSVYLLVMGWLLGYLAEQQKLLRAEVERARFADALHDGVLQSMYAAAMHLEALSRQSASQVVTVAQGLRRIRDFLRDEAQKLRELMQRMRPLEVDFKNLCAHLTELVERSKLGHEKVRARRLREKHSYWNRAVRGLCVQHMNPCSGTNETRL